jgi:phytoene dehydrogenase-like protein
MADYDVMIVGSGINSLAAGALLAKGGSHVTLLERNYYLGGALDRHAPGHRAAWGRMLAAFFPNAGLSFGVLGTELFSGAGAGLALKADRRLGRRGFVRLVGEMLVSGRDWLTETFKSERVHGPFAPWGREAFLACWEHRSASWGEERERRR